MIYTFFCFFRLTLCIPFFIRKNQVSIEAGFFKMVTRSRTLRQQNIRKKIHQLVQHIMCEHFVL